MKEGRLGCEPVAILSGLENNPKMTAQQLELFGEEPEQLWPYLIVSFQAIDMIYFMLTYWEEGHPPIGYVPDDGPVGISTPGQARPGVWVWEEGMELFLTSFQCEPVEEADGRVVLVPAVSHPQSFGRFEFGIVVIRKELDCADSWRALLDRLFKCSRSFSSVNMAILRAWKRGVPGHIIYGREEWDWDFSPGE